LSDTAAVHPALAPLLKLIPPFATDSAGLAASRALFVASDAIDHPGLRRTEVTLPTPKGVLRALLYEPDGARAERAMLHLHAGGLIMGAPEMSDARNAALAVRLRCAILSIDYRLAPEHPFPAALDDAETAYRWLRARGGDVVLFGESAGGGLAAALSRRLAEGGGPVPRFQALVYPMLDPHSGEEGTAPPSVGTHVWTRANNRFAWNCYLAGRAPDAVLPAEGAAPQCLPPTFVAVGALDLFVQEDVAYAMRLLEAGVAVELHVIPGAFHAFDLLGASEPERLLTTTLEDALLAAVAD